MALPGLMQPHGLLIPSLLDHAARWHGQTEIVSAFPDGSRTRHSYAQIRGRALKLADALRARLGARAGDRIATLAWNSHRHVEQFFAIPGIGAVCHTVNPRLFEEQIAYIMNHAGDRFVFTEPDFLPLLERIAPSLASVEGWVVLGDTASCPATTLAPLYGYEELVAQGDERAGWTPVDENAASSLCYTSGTTGMPKGALYAHRSNVLHAMATVQPGALNLSAEDVVMPIANMYHANAWGLPFACAMAGAKLVLPGRAVDGPAVCTLIHEEGVTFACAVPTVWTMALDHLERTGSDMGRLKRILVGGAPMPRALYETFRDRYGVQALHGWGMTELSPLGALGTATAAVAAMDEEARTDQLLKQGRPPFGIDLKITGPDGEPLPHDGQHSGALWARGPWVIRTYYGREDEPLLDPDGWFPTGDMATIDAHGFMRITDRVKDVIKSGGEWISSVELEDHACSHPEVAMAAVVGVPHPRWDERPLLLIVPKPGRQPTAAALLEHLRPRVVKWWLPDDVVVLAELPMTATGKISKLTLRERFREHYAGQAGARSA